MKIESGGGAITMSAEALDGKQLVDTLMRKLKYYTPRQVEEVIEKMPTPEENHLFPRK